MQSSSMETVDIDILDVHASESFVVIRIFVSGRKCLHSGNCQG